MISGKTIIVRAASQTIKVGLNPSYVSDRGVFNELREVDE